MAIDAKAIERQLDPDAQLNVRGRLLTGFGPPPDVDGQSGIIGRKREQFGYGYYRKAERFDVETGLPMSDNGWIRLEQDNPNSRLMFIDRAMNEGFEWVYLGEYGRFQPDQPFSFRTDQYRGLIECGGEHEFPVNQIIELGWHRRPPRYQGLTEYSRQYRGQAVKFPQLEELTAEQLEDVACSCGAKMRPAMFGGKEDLSRHEQIFHGQAARNNEMARTLAGEMGRVVEQAKSGGDANLSPQLAEVLTMMAKRMEQQDELIQTFLGNKPQDTEPAAEAAKSPTSRGPKGPRTEALASDEDATKRGGELAGLAALGERETEN